MCMSTTNGAAEGVAEVAADVEKAGEELELEELELELPTWRYLDADAHASDALRRCRPSFAAVLTALLIAMSRCLDAFALESSSCSCLSWRFPERGAE